MKKIYIAGPDVFREDAIEIGRRYVQLCQKYGFVGLYPMDNVVDFDQPKQKIAQDIFKANVALIQSADIVVANLNPFRGYEADSGTVWECGYGYGLGKEVCGYMSDTSDYFDKFDKNEIKRCGDVYVDSNADTIEDFDYPLNLMIACSVTQLIEGGFEDVLKVLSERF